MSGPVMYIGLWDHRRDGLELFAAVCDHLERMGTVLDRGTNFALAFDHPPLPPGPGPASVEILTPNGREGGLVQFAFSISEIDGDDEYDWSPFENEVESMVQGIEPSLLTISTEWTPAELPDPSWTHAYFLFTSGWMNLEACTESQRVPFLALRDGLLASPLGKGLRWPIESRNAGRDPISRDDLTAKIYHAWTGRVAPPSKATTLPELSAEDLAPRELWFWSHKTPAESLLGRVELATAPRGLTSHTWDFGQDERWRYVASLYEPQGRSLELFLDDLRSTLPAISP